MKICINGDFRHISGIFGRKKIFLKNRTRPHFGHCYYASLSQKSDKTNDEISRKCQKTGFSGIFPAFSAGKICFSKIGLGHILDLPFCISVQNFMKKYKVQLEKFKKYCFSGENRLFRQQKSVLLTIEPCLMVGIVINVFV